MKTIELTLGNDVLEQLEQAAKEQGRSPEEIIYGALDQALKAHRRKMLEPELDHQMAEAYQRFPVRPNDPAEDAFWEEFYQEWLKAQAGNTAEPSAH